MTPVPAELIFAQIRAANPVPTHSSDEVLRPEALSLLASIVQTPRTDGRSLHDRRRRRTTIAALAVAGLLAAGGAAAGSGLIPHGVSHALLSVSPDGDTIHDAHMVVEHVGLDGIRTQIWVGHNSSGGACSYERTLSADGHSEDGSPGCFSGPVHGPHPQIGFRGGLGPAGNPYPPLTYEVVARTSFPRITRIVLVYPTGARYQLTFNHASGWAIGVVPPSVTTLRSTLIGYDASGNVVATQSLPPTSSSR